MHHVPEAESDVRICKCGQTHVPKDEHLRGVPLDMRTYRYDDQVSWNRDLPDLLARTRRVLKSRLGPGFAYISAKEPQARGVLHVHLIIRVDGSGTVPRALVLDAARGVTVRALGRTVGWGSQAACHVIPPDGGSLAREAGYLVKGIGEELAPAAFGLGPLRGQHIARLHEAAAEMPCSEGCPGLSGGCRSHKHRNFGASNSVVSVSRNWSGTGLTRAKLSQRRAEWVEEQRERAHVEPLTLVGRGPKASKPEGGRLDPVRKTTTTSGGHSHTLGSESARHGPDRPDVQAPRVA